jgi:hypothetical protein
MTVADGSASRRPPARGVPGAAAGLANDAASAEQTLLAGQVGAEVATALSSALDRVRLLMESGRIGRRSLQALHDEIQRARRVAMLGQQVSRLAAGRVRQAPESLELPQMLRDALAQRSDEMAMRGLEVRQLLQPAAVAVDPCLLFALLVSLLDWAFEHCRSQTLTLSTALHPWPVHALLRCEFAWRAPDRLDPNADLAFEVERAERGDDPAALDTMPWRLVEQACRAMGVRIERHDSPWQVQLTLAFPETPRRWPKLVDELTALEDPYAMSTQPLAGSQVLVLSTRAGVRRLVRDATAPMGLLMDHVSTLADARECALRRPPDVLIVDERNSEIDRLLAELKAGGSGPALVQVSSSFKGLEISTSGRFEILRVSTEGVMRELPAALRYALTAG